MTRRMLLARMHLHIEHQPQVADHQCVVGMARTTRLVGILAELGPVLMTVDRFDRHIQVQHPGMMQSRQPGLPQRLELPVCTQFGVGSGKGPQHAVFAARLSHPQTDRIDRVGAQSGDVRVEELPSEHGKSDRAQKVGQGGAFGLEKRSGQRSTQ